MIWLKLNYQFQREEKMKKSRKAVSHLYNAARLLNDVTTLLFGDPKKIANRTKNKVIG